MADHAEVFIAGGPDRREAVRAVLGGFDLSVLAGSSVAIKANFNSADPFPASTHRDTLEEICNAILAERPARLTLAERSGMGNTRRVLAHIDHYTYLLHNPH